MKNLEIRSRLPVDKAARKARDFFGPGGLGLKLTQDADLCLVFEGGGGYVKATIGQDDKGTKIELLTQEWEIQVDKFAAEVK